MPAPRAHAYACTRTRTIISHLPTYKPTAVYAHRASIIIRPRQSSSILAHGGSTCSNPRAAARFYGSQGQTGRIFAFEARRFTSFLSHSPPRPAGPTPPSSSSLLPSSHPRFDHFGFHRRYTGVMGREKVPPARGHEDARGNATRGVLTG